MKGGVGKTTISAHVMREFYLRKLKKVLLLDLDPQFNLTQTVMKESNYDPLKAGNKTIFTAMEPPSTVGLFDVTTTSHAPPKASAIAVRLKQVTDKTSYLDLVSGNFALVKYSLPQSKGKLDLVRERFNRFVSEAKQDYDLIVIDCNPSSSFITMCALGVCSSVLTPVRPDRYSILGLDILYQYVHGMPDIHPKPNFNILLNGIPRQGYDPKVENSLRAHNVFGPSVLVSRLYHSRILAASADYTGFATDKPVPHRSRIKAEIAKVIDELAVAWGV
ncbi:Sporulation initiation inhibitor protein Soj [compost metagenome]